MTGIFATAVTFAITSAEQWRVLAPLVAIVAIAATFWRSVAVRDGRTPLFEIGAFCMLAATAYAALPLVWYVLSGMQVTALSHQRLYHLDPAPAEFAQVGWMYAAYMSAFSVAYLRLRANVTMLNTIPLSVSTGTILSLLALFACLQGVALVLNVQYGVTFNVAYDESLYASRAAYSQLPLFARQLIDWCQGLLVVVNCALVMILVARWRSSRLSRALLFFWLATSILSYVLNPGGRFLLLTTLITALLAFHRFVRTIRPSELFLSMTLLFLGFAAAGLLRGGPSILESATDLLGMMDGIHSVFAVSNEFQVAYGSALELKNLATHDALPDVPWQVYASEALLLVPSQLLPFDKVDPVLWYVDTSADPDFFTFGVIAQSILGLGWLEIVLRGLIVGAAFAFIHNWWRRQPANLWRNVFYVWLAFMSYYTIRNTSFYLATLFLNRFAIVVIITAAGAWLARGLTRSSRTQVRTQRQNAATTT